MLGIGLALLICLGVTGCSEDPLAPSLDRPIAVADLKSFQAPPPTLSRLTKHQYHNTVRDLFGADVVPPASLEPDLPSAGLEAIGATVNALSPRGVEQSFDAAKTVAAQLLVDPQRRALIVSCTPNGAADEACMREVVERWGLRLWRRPLTTVEADEVTALGLSAAGTLGSFDAGLEYTFVKMLASPHFLYRVETGTENGKLSAYELATRLSFFLWNSSPDETLLTAAAAGELADDTSLKTQVERMTADPRHRQAVRNFFSEWLHLYELDELGKDPNVFKHFSPELGDSAREETLKLVEHIVFDTEADYRTFFTTRTTFVDRRLAAIYNVPAPAAEGFAKIELPADGPRAGFLGHVSFLGLHAHPVSSSATLRGVFIRKALLCQTVPSPPAGLNTAIPEPSPDAKTLRERLLVHMENPGCESCHGFMDPPGFGLENFDGIGRFRIQDNGGDIDPSGELDGVSFQTPTELMLAIANHPETTSCLTKMMYSYATGHTPTTAESPLLDALHERFGAAGYQVKQLIIDVATSPGFRTMTPTGGQ